MPLVLTQHAPGRSRYHDVEWIIYHFPSTYLPIVKHSLEELGDRRFIYQRPSRGYPPGEAGRYFGHGSFGDPFPDSSNPGLYYIDIIKPEQFAENVPLRNPFGLYYETNEARTPMFRGKSIRSISPQVYYAILAAGQAYSLGPEILDYQNMGVFSPVDAPVDEFRHMEAVPPGTGYVPHQSTPPDPHEAAALHERARDDHQKTLDAILKAVHRVGGSALYNNNVDLLAMVGDRRFLVEAKSLTRQTMAVSRMRYGIGQLLDYQVRYKAALAGAEPILAFGAPLERDLSWIPTILQENQIAFLMKRGTAILPGNDRAKELPFLV